jgi:SAM-dependent methyltransferase
MEKNIKKIDIGCGQNKKEGFIGVDCIGMSGVDIVCNLDKEELPLEDDSVSEVYSMHFMEHTRDLLVIMEEIWRVSRHEAKVTIAVPYYNSIGAFRDPTHKQFFTYETFDHFTSTTKLPSFYSDSKFKIIKKKILFYPSNSNIYGKIRFLHMMPVQLLASVFPYLYEHSWLRLFAAKDLYIELKVIKNDSKK